ncbi:MAG: hypothetical protein AAF231_02900 [Pseudomonadota bacterium]
MSTFLPPEVQAGLDAARRQALRSKHRLRVQAGDRVYRVIDAWENGFSLELAGEETLRGRVDLYDGARHLSQCLIVACEEDGDEMRFEYKRMTEASDTQPLDFVRADDAPVALIARA